LHLDPFLVPLSSISKKLTKPLPLPFLVLLIFEKTHQAFTGSVFGAAFFEKAALRSLKI
jgi:hypothetical protein